MVAASVCVCVYVSNRMRLPFIGWAVDFESGKEKGAAKVQKGKNNDVIG